MKTNDLNIYFPPPPPTQLPMAGATMIDPVFGTPMLRATDATKAPASVTSLGISYSAIWDAFNSNSTHLAYYGSDGNAWLLDIDPEAFTVSNWRPWNGISTANPMYWSRLDPDRAYGLRGTYIDAYDVKADKWTTVADLTKLFPTGFANMGSRGWAKDDSRVMIVPLDTSYAALNNAIAVYDFKKDKLVWYQPQVPSNKGLMSSDGTMVLSCVANGATAPNGTPLPPTGFVYGVDSGAQEAVRDDVDNLMGHGDWGTTVWAVELEAQGYYDPVVRRVDQNHLANVHQFSPISPAGPTAGVSPRRTWYQGSHWSLRGNDESLVTGSYFYQTSAAGYQDPKQNIPCPFMDEVFMISTDPASRATVNRRLCHHQATAWAGYQHQPHACESQDKRLIAFNSSMGTGRPDVWLVQTGLGGEPTVVLAGVEFTQTELLKLKNQAGILK